jgi:DNA-binding NarL/FixJ family response regulator
MLVPHPEAAKLPALTPRQWEVSYWLWKGKRNWEIGAIVSCSEETVKKHLQQVYKKLGVEYRIAAIRVLDQYRNTPPWRLLSQQDADIHE